MTKRKPGIRLPNKLSALIRATLPDLAKAERAKGVKIDMGVWHEPNSKCAVCWVGAVMRRAIGDSVAACPDLFSDSTRRKLVAINLLRTGDVATALMCLRSTDVAPDFPLGLDRSVTPYHHDPKAFKREMRKLADDLEKAGL